MTSHERTLEDQGLAMSDGVALNVAGSVAPTGELEVTTSTGLWASWATIAVEHETEAERARKRLGRLHAAEEEHDANEELHAALIAINAAAFAIDGLYGSVKRHIAIPENLRATWMENELPRHGWIFETLKRGFILGAATNRWPRELKWLFDLRGGNVHFDEQFRSPARHPVLGNVTVERILYSPESARRAVDLMLDLLTVATTRPRPQASELADFAARWRPNIGAIERRRRRALST